MSQWRASLPRELEPGPRATRLSLSAITGSDAVDRRRRQALGVFPSPLWGGARGGGSCYFAEYVPSARGARLWSRFVESRVARFAARHCGHFIVSLLRPPPPPPAPPHKGRGIAYGFEEAIAGSHKIDSEVTPRAQVELDGEIQEGFSTVAGPQGGQRTARVAGGFVHCSCGDTVWRRGPLGHGQVWAIQGRAAAAGPAVAAQCPATILSARVFRRCWTRRR